MKVRRSTSAEVSSSPRATLRPKGDSKDLAKQGGNQSSNLHITAQADGGGETPADVPKERIVVVQFEMVWCSQEHRDMLHALRNVQHRMLNASIRAWWESEGKDRAAATKAVMDVLENERTYWGEQIPKIELGIEKLRAKTKKDDPQLIALQRKLQRASVCAEMKPPSAIYDACVYFTSGKYREYRKHAFRGDKSMASFREGQPIRVRDGGWTLEKTDKGGVYDLIVPLKTDGRKLERALIKVIPDGGSMHGWAKMLTGGNARPCDARMVYSENKGKWYVKLTIAVSPVRLRPEGGVAAIRRGIKSAFAVVAQNGDAHTIDGHDVIVHKQRANARRAQIGRHLRSGELGSGARGHGKKRRFKALTQIDEAETKFVDAKIKQWAAMIVKWCLERNVSRLLVADGGVAEFYDRVADAPISPFLHKWPLAAMNNRLIESCKNAGVTTEKQTTSLDGRSCPGPGCGHKNEKMPAGFTYECDVCGLKRPADQIVAWNMLREKVGDEPIKERIRKQDEMVDELKKKRRAS